MRSSSKTTTTHTVGKQVRSHSPSLSPSQGVRREVDSVFHHVIASETKVEPYSPLNSGTGYEMGNLNGGGHAAPPPQDNTQDFYAEVDQIRGGIDTVNANITQIESLHQRSLNDIDEAAQQTTTHRLEALVTETSALNSNLANRIKTLKGKASRDPTKAPQVGVLDRNFKDSLRKYQLVEKGFADRTREQMARQYRIVKPDATEEEVRQACEDSQGQQVFSQAVSISRSAPSRMEPYLRICIAPLRQPPWRSPLGPPRSPGPSHRDPTNRKDHHRAGTAVQRDGADGDGAGRDGGGH